MSLTVESGSPFEDLARLYEADPAFVAPRLLSSAGDLSHSNLSTALSFYEFLAEREPHSYYGAIARKKIEDITGSQGLTFGRFAFLSNEALKSLGDYRVSVPWLLGGLAFPIGRAFAGKKWWGTLTGLGLEIPTVTLSTHGLFKLSGKDPPGNLGDNMLRFGLVASLFRITSPLGVGAFRLTHSVNPVTQLPERFIAQAAWTRPLFQYGTQYSALVTAHSIEAKTKLAPSVPGSNIWTESLVSLAEMNLAGHATGGITQPFTRSLLTRSYFSGKNPPWKFRFPNLQLSTTPRFAYATTGAEVTTKGPTVMAMAGRDRSGGSTVKRLKASRKATLAMLLRTDSHRLVQSIGTADNTANIRDRLLNQTTEAELTAVEAVEGRARSRELAKLLFKYNPTVELMGTTTTPGSSAGDGSGYTALVDLLIELYPALYSRRVHFGTGILGQAPEIELREYRKTKMELDAVWKQDWFQLYTEWESVFRAELTQQFVRENPTQSRNATARDQFVRNRLHRIYLHALALKFMDDYPQLFASLPPTQRPQPSCNLGLCQWVAQAADQVDYFDPVVNRLGRSINPTSTESVSEAVDLENKRYAVTTTLVRSLYYTGHISHGSVPDGKALHLARQNYHYYAINMERLPTTGRIHKADLRDCDSRTFIHQEREGTVFQMNDPLLYRTLEMTRHIHTGDLSPYPTGNYQLNWFLAATVGNNPRLPYINFMARHHPHVLAVLQRPDGTTAPHLMVDHFRPKETKAWLNFTLGELSGKQDWMPLETRGAYGLYELLKRTPALQKMAKADAWARFRNIFEIDLHTPTDLIKTITRLEAIRGDVRSRSEPIEAETLREIEELQTITIGTLAPTYSRLRGRQLLPPTHLAAYERNLLRLNTVFQNLQQDMSALDRRIETKLATANPELEEPALSEATRTDREARMQAADVILNLYEEILAGSPEISARHRASLLDAIHETRALLAEFAEDYFQNEGLLHLAEAQLKTLDKRITRRLERSSAPASEADSIPAEAAEAPVTTWAELSVSGKTAQLREEGIVLYVPRSQDSAPALEFLRRLDHPNQNKILRIAHLLATGEVNLSGDRFRKVNDTGDIDLYEIRDPGTAGLRVFVTRREDRWYLLNGYFKQSQAMNPQEFSRAVRLAKEIKAARTDDELETNQRFVTVLLWQDLSQRATALSPQLEASPEFTPLFAQLKGPFEAHHFENIDLIEIDARLNRLRQSTLK